MAVWQCGSVVACPALEDFTSQLEKRLTMSWLSYFAATFFKLSIQYLALLCDKRNVLCSTEENLLIFLKVQSHKKLV